MLSKMQIEKMITLALEQLSKSYAPYSGFRVGAALLTKDGRYYTGCNIENAAYTPTNCAERTAFFKAVSEGEREFSGSVLQAEQTACRQIIRRLAVSAAR